MGFRLESAFGLQYLRLELGKASVLFSTRLGGVSQGPFAGLNLGLHVGDEESRVLENRSRFLKLLGTGVKQIVACQQVHGASVHKAVSADKGRGGENYHTAIPGNDALITSRPELPLALFSADCLLAFLYDPATPAVGIAHAGWRGSSTGVLAATVNAMVKEFGTLPGGVTAAFSPAIGPCCYLVGEDVARAARGEGEENYLVPAGPGRYRFDLVEYNRRQLLQTGVNGDRIITGNYCTSCRTDLFYSYRKAVGGVTGRMMGVIMLNREAGENA